MTNRSMGKSHDASGPLSGRERRRRHGYTKSLAHAIAHMTAGYQIGFDLAALPGDKDGSFRLDLVRGQSMVNGMPATMKMLEWVRRLLDEQLEHLGLPPSWVKVARVDVSYRRNGSSYDLVSVGRVETVDSAAEVTITNRQPPIVQTD